MIAESTRLWAECLWRGDSELEPVPDDLLEVFVLNEETIEPEPERGDFWGELEKEEIE